METQTKRSGASLNATAASPAALQPRRIWTRDPVADLAFALALLAAGAVTHWQFETNTNLSFGLQTPSAPALTAALLVWGCSASIHVWRRRSLLVLVSAAAMLAPTLVELPYAYLCREGHCG